MINEVENLSERDWEKIELYMKSGAKPWKIAKAFHFTPAEFKKALNTRYKKSAEDVLEKYDSIGQMLIEATQFQKALSGNITMLIWLGKVRCGQKEPEMSTQAAPLQDTIDKDHIIMKLQHELTQLKALLEKNGNECKAE